MHRRRWKRTQNEAVSFNIGQVIRYNVDNQYFERVDFKIINHTLKRVTSYTAFFDEMVSQTDCSSRCFPRCIPLINCDVCNNVSATEFENLESLELVYSSGWPNIQVINSPRAIKFTLLEQVKNDRPQSFTRGKNRPTKQEIVFLMKAICEILRRHSSVVESVPYLATPATPNVDSIYQKTMNGELGIDLQFQISRATIESDEGESGAIYVIL